MRLIFVFIAVYLDTWPTYVESTFFIEYTSNKYHAEYGVTLKTFLYRCDVDREAPIQKDMKPPILCALVDDHDELTKIYSIKNFFIVRNAKLPSNQPIEFMDVLEASVPSQLYLAISHKPLDYPDFLLPEETGNSDLEAEIGSTDDKKDNFLSHFLNLTNLKVIRENPIKFSSAMQAYMKELMKVTDLYWQKFSKKGKSHCSGNYKLQKQNEEDCQGVQLDAKTEAKISKLLTKMIDPCLMRSIASIDWKWSCLLYGSAKYYCKLYCKALAVFPLVLGRGVSPRCHNLASGACFQDTCMCSKLSTNWPFYVKDDPKKISDFVSMAECNNRVITIASKDRIQRFPNRYSRFVQWSIPLPPAPEINVHWGWEMIPHAFQHPRKVRSIQERREEAKAQRNAKPKNKWITWGPNIEYTINWCK